MAPVAQAAVRQYWVAAVPTTWNAVPNGKDATLGTVYPPSQTIFPTVVYQRYTPHWRTPMRNAPYGTVDHDSIPGPLIRARVGDLVLVHFKNMDTLRNAPHSMHFHAFHYRPSSDGAYLPGFSGKDAAVPVGQSWTYRLRARADSQGVWPYHDHSPSMHDSILGGMYGVISILGRHERAPDREFQVFFAPVGEFQGIDGRAFVGNTPVFHSRVGDLVQWDVLALGSDHHTFHVHGHRWHGAGPSHRHQDVQELGPADSFRIRWREDAPGTWLYHCHVEDHMERGMIGVYQVAAR